MKNSKYAEKQIAHAARRAESGTGHTDFQIPRLLGPRPAKCRPIHFPIVRGPAIDGHG